MPNSYKDKLYRTLNDQSQGKVKGQFAEAMRVLDHLGGSRSTDNVRADVIRSLKSSFGHLNDELDQYASDLNLDEEGWPTAPERKYQDQGKEYAASGNYYCTESLSRVSVATGILVAEIKSLRGLVQSLESIIKDNDSMMETLIKKINTLKRESMMLVAPPRIQVAEVQHTRSASLGSVPQRTVAGATTKGPALPPKQSVQDQVDSVIAAKEKTSLSRFIGGHKGKTSQGTPLREVESFLGPSPRQ